MFGRFLEGESLVECYAAVAEVANYWLDVLDRHDIKTRGDELVGRVRQACGNKGGLY